MNAIPSLPALAHYLQKASDAWHVRVRQLTKLSGGAVQENWLLDVDLEGGSLPGTQALVLRTDAPSSVATSHGRAQEFALLGAAFNAGVTVPQPLWLCTDLDVLGRPFFLMRKAEGTAAAHRLVRDTQLGGDRRELAQRLGRELALIHSIRPPREDLGFLAAPLADTPARDALARARIQLTRQPLQRPVIEWTLRWLELHADALPCHPWVLCHRDFRTGNYMVDEQGLTAVLDWEFSGWGDPLEDIGWFCAKCWRFGSRAEAGGIGEREDFYRGYRQVSDVVLAPDAVRWWEVMAHVNWAVIALQQYERYASGNEKSLLLGLTGYMLPELELEMLAMTKEV